MGVSGWIITKRKHQGEVGLWLYRPNKIIAGSGRVIRHDLGDGMAVDENQVWRVGGLRLIQY